MPMILIIEGPDGAGKTTLAQQLATVLRLEVHHEGPPPLDISPLEHYTTLLDEALLYERDIVFDRFALGERVYGPIFRNTDRLPESDWRDFEERAAEVGVFQIMCLPPYKVCYDAWSSGRLEMIRDESIFRRTYERFAAFGSMPSQYHYDWTRGPQEFEKLLLAIKRT